MNENFVRLLLDNFWRLALALLGFFAGILWACFGLKKALVILGLSLLGWALGKLMDDRRSRGNFSGRVGRRPR